MATTARTASRAPSATWARRGVGIRIAATAAIGVGAVLFVWIVAIGNTWWFDLLAGWLEPTGAVARGLVFSSWLLMLGGIVVVRRPAAFGFRLGRLRSELRVVAVTCVVAVAATLVLLRLVGPIPYSDASLFIEAVDVPFTEELVFRGVLLTALVAVLGALWAPRPAVVLAVVVNAVAFGTGHLANAASLGLTPFVVGQAIFAIVLGAACAALMVRSRSIYPAMLLHAAVNAGVVLGS